MPKIQIEEALYVCLKEVDLLSFQHKLAVEKQLSKVEHFDHVTDEELTSYGLSAPAVRRLRSALDRIKKGKKSKIFSKKPSKTIKTVDCESPTSPQKISEPSTSNDSPASATPCLISRDDVKLMETLGQGGFATVKRGIWQRSGSLVKVDCAVKVLNQLSEQAVDDLHAEIKHMQKLKHHNVIQLYGIVFGEPTMLVIEYCDGGALLDRLRNTKKPVLLVTKLLSYALQIAAGMAYLENRHVIHRDLALRNILLAENEEVVKICDFGLTRSLEDNAQYYVMSPQKKVPFSWCPPEALRFRQFSHKSDCWAFGVTLWELNSYGEDPWMGLRAADVLKVTEQGEQLKKPRKCLKEIYEIMQMCWNLKPELRPKFSHLRNLLLDIKFMTAETRESFMSEDPDSLELSLGDHVIIIAENGQSEWYGQCVASRKFGKFPHSLVSVKSHRVPDTPAPASKAISSVSSPSALAAMSSSTSAYQKNRSVQISKPIPGSLIHTGHGDIDREKCWGNVDRIDEIYLKNPVIRPPPIGTETRSHGVSFISSITALHDDFLATSNTNAKIRPVSSSPIKLDFDPLNAWDQPASSTIPTTKSATNIPAKPTPPPIKPKLANSQNSFASTGISTSQQNYTTTAVPRPKPNLPHNFNDAWNQPATAQAPTFQPTPQQIPQPKSIEQTSVQQATSIAHHRRNQTQPVVLPSVVSRPATTVETPMPENDPFFIDPNLKNFTIKPQPIQIQQQASEISWRPQSIARMDQFSRPQSARFDNSFTFTPKPAPAVDQSILALLDPLVSVNAKAVSPPQLQSAVTGPPKLQKVEQGPKSVVLPPETAAKINQSAALPRPQSASHYNTAPSALNVLAFVSQNGNHQLNGQPKLTTQQPTSNPAKTAAHAWTYLPPSTLSTAPSNKTLTNTTSTASNQSTVVQNAVKATAPSATSQPVQNVVKTPTPVQQIPATGVQNTNKPINYASMPTTVSIPPKTSHYVPASTLLPPPSELASSSSSTPTNSAGSLLPPPSQLMLSGLKNEPLASEVKPKSSDSAYGSLTSNSSASRLTLITDPFAVNGGGAIPRMEKSQPTQQIFNIQHSPIPAYNQPQANSYFAPQINQAPTMIVSQNNQPMYYSQSGIPFLLPTPLNSTPRPSTSTQLTSSSASQPIISLQDLDIDRMVSDVKKKADFASEFECKKALKESGYEVNEAVHLLKVEKLIEIGICTDRPTAVRALTANNWDVNATAIAVLNI
ncbi:Non-specific protein-tyrosine kinase [Aphelenchoides bicaudatus]|nr:Non-specific protein-tyrosine kinase [Aphelenchoides bicaudatus]